MLRVLIVLVVLAGASAGAWLILEREPGPPAVPGAPGTELGLSVRWAFDKPFLCATAEVAPGPSRNITMTQARARTRALLAQASVDAQRALLARVRSGDDGLPDLGDPWAVLPDGVVSETLLGSRPFDAPGDLQAGRSTQGLPWQNVVAATLAACERLQLDEQTAERLADVLQRRADELAGDLDALAAFWDGERM